MNGRGKRSKRIKDEEKQRKRRNKRNKDRIMDAYYEEKKRVERENEERKKKMSDGEYKRHHPHKRFTPTPLPVKPQVVEEEPNRMSFKAEKLHEKH